MTTATQPSKIGRPRLSETSETKIVGVAMPVDMLEEILASGTGTKSDRIRRVLSAGLKALSEDG